MDAPTVCWDAATGSWWLQKNICPLSCSFAQSLHAGKGEIIPQFKKKTLKTLPSPSSFTHALTPNWQSQWKRILHFGNRTGSALAAGLIPNPLELKELVPTSTGFGSGLAGRNLVLFVLGGGLSAAFVLQGAPTCDVVTDTWIYISVSELGWAYNLASFKSHFSHYNEIWTPLVGGLRWLCILVSCCAPSIPCALHLSRGLSTAGGCGGCLGGAGGVQHPWLALQESASQGLQFSK